MIGHWEHTLRASIWWQVTGDTLSELVSGDGSLHEDTLSELVSGDRSLGMHFQTDFV